MTAAAPFRGLTFLVVDDDPETREALGALLELEGAAVMLAADGEEALGCLGVVLPDAVVTDINMPRRDGVGLLRAIRASEAAARLPVVAVTGVPERVDDTSTAGFDDVLLKPVGSAALARSLSRLLLGDPEPVADPIHLPNG